MEGDQDNQEMSDMSIGSDPIPYNPDGTNYLKQSHVLNLNNPKPPIQNEMVNYGNQYINSEPSHKDLDNHVLAAPQQNLMFESQKKQELVGLKQINPVIRDEKANGEAEPNNDPVSHSVQYKADLSAPAISYFGLFKYTSACDRVLLVFAYIFSMGQGVGQSCLSLIIGDGLGYLASPTPNDEMVSKVGETSIKAIIFACCIVFVSSVGVFLWKLIGSSIERKIKIRFFNCILEQDTAWYDVISPEKITSIYSEETANFIQAIGDANHMLLMALGMGIGGICNGLFKSVIFTLI